MNHEKLVILIIGFVATVTAKFCGKLGSYDALCITEDAVFILTASPCHERKDLEQIALTVINTKGKLQEYDIGSSKDITKPISFGRKDVGVMLEMHRHPAGKKMGNIHVTVSLGNFSDNGVKSRKTLLEVFFYLGKEGKCFHAFSGASFYPSPFCKSARRTGNFSTYCISKETTSIDKASEGIFIVSMDPCSVPFSYWVIALFPSKNIEVMKRFTASKTDKFVPVESATCGIKTKVTADHGKFPITLLYGCNDATAVQIVNDYYFPEHGELCPAPNCTSPSPLQSTCNLNMITGDNQMRKISADLKLAGCGKAMRSNLDIKMEGQAYPLKLRFSKEDDLADFKFDNKKQSFTEHKMPEAVNGYVPTMGGHVGVLVESLDDLDEGILNHHHINPEKKYRNLAYAIVERHYGEENGSVHFISPLFYKEFSLPKCDSDFKSNAKLNTGVKILIAASVIAVIAAVIFFVYHRYRGTRNRLDGLPHQIELNYDELEKETMST